MAAPHPDRSDPIASTYEFRAFAQRADTADTTGRSRRIGLLVAALVAAVVLGVVVIVLVA